MHNPQRLQIVNIVFYQFRMLHFLLKYLKMRTLRPHKAASPVTFATPSLNTSKEENFTFIEQINYFISAQKLFPE